MTGRNFGRRAMAGLQIVDPGDAGTIRAYEHDAVVNLVSAAAETRTLPAPFVVGQRITTAMKTDGGDITLTVTGGYNEAGDTVVTFTEVGQWATFVAQNVSGTMTWRIAGSNIAGAGESISVPDDATISLGDSADAQFLWETADANANLLMLELPAGGATNVPVVVIGDTIENDDQGLFDGIVSTTVAIQGSTATATGPAIRFYKSRGTNSAPTVVTSGDDAGSLDFYGCVAADEYVRSARILAETTGTIATTRGPGVLTFQTATDAAPSVLTTGLSISAAQVVTLAAGVTTGNHTFSLTITAGADGVGSNGEQLTSGGAAAETSWTAAACLREYKHVEQERHDAQAVLDEIIRTPVYNFHYRKSSPDRRVTSTGDHETTYTGIMADEAPWATHHNGRILNPINALGYTVLGFKALADENVLLRSRLAAIEAKLSLAAE